MVKRAAKRPTARQAAPSRPVSGGPRAADPSVTPPGTTGRYLILFDRDAAPQAANVLSGVAGMRLASSADFEGGIMSAEDLGGADAMMFPALGVAVADAPPEQTHLLGAASDSGILAIEPERIVHAIGDAAEEQLPQGISDLSLDYLRGYRDAVNALYDKLATGAEEGQAEVEPGALAAETDLTWGLQATRAARSKHTGQGVRVAVLDTGLDVGHPDFVGRAVTTASFITGETVQDGHGHGTHCIGTACGPERPQSLPRYGVATGADIFAGKVLSNRGSGADTGILAGIQWAIDNGCAVISMSLGAPVRVGQSFSQVFEHVARRALMQGTLIIAAAGNESQRPQRIEPVSHPANCPSIMAVGALDRNMRVARFSCGGLNPQGGQVDIAGPGSMSAPAGHGRRSTTPSAEPAWPPRTWRGSLPSTQRRTRASAPAC